ncbi:NAD(+)/NADH kinase [Caldalkalibacillus thermarum TA2.A1]|uniref:NAD kinase n=1 Tax=Caldalkalibacillus thermarum (strain TA2.A1) TaxID=986075 RepID=A0A8X8I1W0_CALTT|nr:NAD(+)/NADH kinase [Caldalkalibacillus thermarum]QZT32661.1 NAD(+)/NADH kinase [Caldalkalibacillus thermarum TA2.A1]
MKTLTIGLAINRGKPKALIVARELIPYLEKKGIRVVLEQRVADYVDRKDLAVPYRDFYKHADILFVFGGDGTILGIARDFAPYAIPILGINLGYLGFLSEAEPEDLPDVVDALLEGRYQTEDRMMLQAELFRNGKLIETWHALNDIGIAKGSYSRMITCKIFLQNKVLNTFYGDGLIVSTPTGSTAYSMSAGGPIVAPNMQALLITPVCPHSLTARPIILSPTEEITIEVSATHQEIGLSVDGQIGYQLEVFDQIRIRRSPYTTILIKWKDRTFFDVIRDKFHQGLDK